jgi:hypothetical protein
MATAPCATPEAGHPVGSDPLPQAAQTAPHKHTAHNTQVDEWQAGLSFAYAGYRVTGLGSKMPLLRITVAVTVAWFRPSHEHPVKEPNVAHEAVTLNASFITHFTHKRLGRLPLLPCSLTSVLGLSTACLTKNWPTGPSSGVKGSVSPQATRIGQLI